jgi:peptidoglycan/xylan/chitin deacetylase (PgdA/CDA1 family)
MNSKLTVVMYHYVRDLLHARYPNIKGLDLSLFKEHLKLFKNKYNVVSIKDVIDAFETNNELPPNAILLTFDDGYSDHYHNVFPLLDEMKMSGAFYLPAKTINDNDVLDVNKIHFILAAANDISKLINDVKKEIEQHKEEYNLESFDSYVNKYAIANRFNNKETVLFKQLFQKVLPEPLRIKITNKLFERYLGINLEVFSRELYMNKDQLKCMINNGMYVGIHGHNHYHWASLNRNDQETEIKESVNFLKSLGVDMNCLTAAYPYGSYNQDSINLLSKYNCKLAFTVEAKIASLEKDERLKLPRIDACDILE